jgi:hypothetical protein
MPYFVTERHHETFPFPPDWNDFHEHKESVAFIVSPQVGVGLIRPPGPSLAFVQHVPSSLAIIKIKPSHTALPSTPFDGGLAPPNCNSLPLPPLLLHSLLATEKTFPSAHSQDVITPWSDCHRY